MIKLANKLDDTIDRLHTRLAGYERERAMRTPRQRKQASEARCEAYNLRAAHKAAIQLRNAAMNSTLPNELQKFTSAAAIRRATEVKIIYGQGYYGESSPDIGNYRDQSTEAVALRNFISLDDRADIKKTKLDQALSEARTIEANGFFPTPDNIIDILIGGVQITGKNILEPSAGIGSIAERVAEKTPGELVCIEQHSKLVEILEMKELPTVQADFLSIEPVPEFDLVLMNPPFERHQDCQHIRHAARFLKPSGQLRAIMPGHADRYGEAHVKVRREFAAWVEDHQHAWVKLPDGAFKNGFKSTAVSTIMLAMQL